MKFINNKEIISPTYMIIRDIRHLTNSNVGKVFRLCSNESPLGTNYRVIDTIIKGLDKLHTYPDPDSFDIKHLVSKNLGIDEKCIVFGNGSTELIEILINYLFIELGNTVISQYTYPLYEMLVAKCNSDIIKAPMIDWQYDLDGMVAAVTKKTKAIFLTNPNNPTGSWITLDRLCGFLKKIPSNILVIIDEAYYDYMDNVPEYASGINLLDKFSNLVITRTFSKVYGLAGLRIGYAIAAPEIISKIASRKQSANVNIVAQYAAVAAYLDDEYRRKVILEVNKNRLMLENKLQSMNIKFISTNTNFIMIRVKQASIDAYKKLLGHNIVVQPMEIYGLSEYIRVSIGNEEDTNKFISILSYLV